ncbi:MAG: DUF58 domain-containing protein [Defluviitaleaceae bacterium]|nr:DUF58 domain-containing protein [Defluviitaleaceae bacterium]
MTKRFIYLLAGGTVPVFLFGFINFAAGLIIFLLYNFVCFAMLFMDRKLSPSQKDFIVSRDDNDTLYFKAENEIFFKIRNLYHDKIKLSIRDELPDWHFNVISEENATKVIDGGAEEEFSYKLIPLKRGSFKFLHVYICQIGILGLCRKYYKLNLEREFKVYPNLQNLSKYRLIVNKHRLLSHGQRRINLRGQGSEFESLREYVEGDDFRKINWMVTARENKLIVNQYEAEKNQPVFILLDTGRTMSYSIKGYKKVDYAINAALILSDIVNQKGDNSGLVVFNTEVDSYIPPGKGDGHRKHLMETLYHISDTKFTSDYRGLFLELLAKQKRRSIVFVFTDFETEDEMKDLVNSVSIIARRHVPVVVFMKNESLEKLAQVDGKETKDQYKQAIATDFLRARNKMIKTLNRKGIICVESEAEKFAIDSVNQYLLVREKFSR